MKKIESFWCLGICMAMLFGSLGAIDVSGQEYCWRLRDEVPAPVKKSVNAWIGNCNARLEVLIANLRKWDEAKIKEELPNILETFSHTYLKTPIMELDLGNKCGWEQVIWELDKLADTNPCIVMGPIEVEAIPLTSEPHKAKGLDYRLNIRTQLDIGHSGPGLRGCGLHRYTCDPIECD